MVTNKKTDFFFFMNWLSSWIWSDELSNSLPSLPFSYDPNVHHIVRYTDEEDSQNDYLVKITDLDWQFFLHLQQETQKYPISVTATEGEEYENAPYRVIPFAEFFARLTLLPTELSSTDLATWLKVDRLYQSWPQKWSEGSMNWWFRAGTTRLEQQKPLQELVAQVTVHAVKRGYVAKVE